jgi:CRP-like cAMP-binding protein
LKDWLKGLTSSKPRQYSIDELMVLERWNDAEALLKKRIKLNSRDLHARAKLAEVLTKLRKPMEAVEQYRWVAEAYAQDGFHDKGLAILNKAARLAPADTSLPSHIQKLRRGKDMGRLQGMVMQALKEADREAGGTATATVELEQIWARIAGSDLVERLQADQLARLFGAVQIARVGVGQVLARANEEAPEIFIIASAVVEAVTEDGVSLRTFGDGDVIGESTLLEHKPWPATYRVAQGGEVLCLTREGVEKAMTGNPDPRQLLDALRAKRNDQAVAANVGKLGTRA